jgi:hypothetical protein
METKAKSAARMAKTEAPDLPKGIQVMLNFR